MFVKVLNKHGLQMYFGLENELGGKTPFPPPLKINLYYKTNKL
jgi:hypothetical protein